MRKVLAIANTHKQRMLTTKASVDYKNVLSGWYDYFRDAADAGENWQSKFAPVMTSMANQAGQEWADELGFNFSNRNYIAEEWFDAYTMRFAQEINQTTLDGLAGMMKQAQEEGWSIDAITSRAQDMFQQWSTGEGTAEDFQWYADRMPPHRARMIARTETIRASNAGSHELFRRMGAKRKSWSAVMDKRTRTTHEQAGIAYAEGGNPGPILMSETFTVGQARLMYPGDPNGTPEETINCRCVLLPVVTLEDIERIQAEQVQEQEPPPPLLGPTGAAPEFKTIKEAEEYAARMLTRTGRGKVDYSNIDLETANRVNSELRHLQKQGVPPLNEILTVPVHKLEGANAEMTNRGTLTISKGSTVRGLASQARSDGYDRDLLLRKQAEGKLTRKQEVSVQYSTWVADWSIEGIIRHEMGHNIHFQYHNIMKVSLDDANALAQQVGKELQRSEQATQISEYPATASLKSRAHEYIAEGFVLYVGGRRDLLTPGMLEYFDSFLERAAPRGFGGR